MAQDPSDDDAGEFVDLPRLNLPPLNGTREDDDAFMGDLVKAGNYARLYLKLAAAAVPSQSLTSMERGVLLGHVVRLFKLYDSILFLVTERRGEIAFLLVRPLAETAVHLVFLAHHGSPQVYEQYQKASLAYEKKVWDEVEKRKKSPPLPIEKRMQDGAEKTITRAGFKLDDISWRDRNWAGDTYQKAEKIGWIELYEFGFRPCSHGIHGTWHDLEFNHLKQEGAEFLPDLDYTWPKPQMLESSSVVSLLATVRYMNRILGEDASHFCATVEEMIAWFRQMSQLHEAFLATKGKEL